MKISELLLEIGNLAEQNNLSQPFIVGGLVRDRISKNFNNIHDIDITTGNESVYELSKIVSQRFSSTYKEMPDTHSRVIIKSGGVALKLDFSSNFKIPGITHILKKGGVEEPSEMQKELYSRDFTCNAGLMTMDLKRVLDLTGKMKEDIESKIIRTCLTPNLTFGYNNKRIIRAIYFGAKLGFELDDNIVEYIKDNKELINNIDKRYIVEKLNKAIKYNKNKVVEIIRKTEIKEVLPIFGRK